MSKWIVGVLAAVLTLSAMAGAGAQQEPADPETANVDVTVWRRVSDPSLLYVSTRPEGGSWRTLNTPLDMSALSSSGNFHQSNAVRVRVSLEGGGAANVDVTVWRRVSDPSLLYVSTRPEGGRWRTLDTALDMSALSSSGNFHQSNAVRVTVTLPGASDETGEDAPDPSFAPYPGDTWDEVAAALGTGSGTTFQFETRSEDPYRSGDDVLAHGWWLNLLDNSPPRAEVWVSLEAWWCDPEGCRWRRVAFQERIIAPGGDQRTTAQVMCISDETTGFRSVVDVDLRHTPDSSETAFTIANVDCRPGGGNPAGLDSAGTGPGTTGAAPVPNLVVDTPAVSESAPTAGSSFTLRATVRNQGGGRSASTTLRYYISADAPITTGDTEVGTDPVGGLAASASSPQSISLTAPADPGTYYYGACVDPVSGESDTGNNCSSGARVTVSSGAASYEVGDLLPGVPTSGGISGVRLSGGGISISGGTNTIIFRSGGYIELQNGTRYTCDSGGGCEVVNGRVNRGTMVSGTPSNTPSPTVGPASPSNQRYVWQGSTTVVTWDAVPEESYSFEVEVRGWTWG